MLTENGPCGRRTHQQASRGHTAGHVSAACLGRGPEPGAAGVVTAHPSEHREHTHGPLVTYPLQLLVLLLQLGLHLPQPLLDVAVPLLGLSANTA